ncbi:MAG: hypothetical protein HDR83_07140 [Bacteroides sp.]|nr:hypothetical protein [Bacteroides sp.]
MSKTTLKKALSQFTPEQLRGLILDIYSKYKDAKEFLDFFADPDIEKTTERYREVLNKEINRVYHHRWMPRLSVIKRILKDFSNLEPGFEAEATLRLETLRRLTESGRGSRSKYQEALFNSIGRFAADTCTFLERNGVLDEHFPKIRKWVDESKTTKAWLNGFYNILNSAIEPWK